MHLATQGRICTQQELLSCLSFGVERTAYLGSTERTVGQHAAVFACEGYALRHTLVDNAVANLGQTVNVGLASTIVATLYGVVE